MRPLDLVVSLGDLKDHGVQQWCAAHLPGGRGQGRGSLRSMMLEENDKNTDV